MVRRRGRQKWMGVFLAAVMLMPGSPAYAEGKEITIGSGQTCSTLDVLNAYDGWYAVRFGFGQTLTRMNDDLTISGWLVEDDWTA